MRLTNVDGRLKLVVGEGIVDVHRSSGGRLPSDPNAAFDVFDEVRSWAETAPVPDEPWVPESAGAPVPRPPQVFAIGLNYAGHAAETGFDRPDRPVVFTKYMSSLCGAVSEVELPVGSVDWEVEIVAVIGRLTRRIPVRRAWEHVAAVTLGQDLSERELQRSGPSPQFGLAKSFPGFSPIGPVLVTPDEFTDPDDIELGCAVNGEKVQHARTRDMLFSIAELVSYLSGVVTLLPGDLIFTGTPPGVGMGRTPPRYLRPGDQLDSWAEGIGELRQTFVAAPFQPSPEEDR